MELEELIAVARGGRPADLLIKNANVIDVLSGDIFETGVAVFRGRIAGFGDYRARTTIDAGGRYLSPGFIDGHVHVESSMLTPAEYARSVVPHGTTAIVADPHEIANVLGIEGINYMLRSSEHLPLGFFVMLPSCVPATDMETSGAVLSSGDLALMIGEPRVLGIAELMNYAGVIRGDHEVLNKVRLGLTAGKRVDGHAPGVSGKELSAYVGAGIKSDHESIAASEALEKLRLGMYVMVREGTNAKNLKELTRIVTPRNNRQFLFVTDDESAEDLLEVGHIDHLLRLAVVEGLDPVMAVQMATINAAQYFKLEDRGAIAPGYRADLVLLDDLSAFRVAAVMNGGKVVARDGEALPFEAHGPKRSVRSTVNVDVASLDDLRIPARGGAVRVIEVVPDQIVTNKLAMEAPVRLGSFTSDPSRDLLKVAVVERHMASGNIGLGFARGFGLKHGAIASTVAHDSHNIIAVGVEDADLKQAVLEIKGMKGGLVVVAGGRVLASLDLPIAGLMSDKPARDVAKGVRAAIEAAGSLGCRLRNPFMQISFLALPVIPELRITDKGLVDVARQKLVSAYAGAEAAAS